MKREKVVRKWLEILLKGVLVLYACMAIMTTMFATLAEVFASEKRNNLKEANSAAVMVDHNAFREYMHYAFESELSEKQFQAAGYKVMSWMFLGQWEECEDMYREKLLEINHIKKILGIEP